MRKFTIIMLAVLLFSATSCQDDGEEVFNETNKSLPTTSSQDGGLCGTGSLSDGPG